MAIPAQAGTAHPQASAGQAGGAGYRGLVPGNLLVSGSTYQNGPDIVAGKTLLPPGCGAEEGGAVRGYVVVFEGDDASGYSAYSPGLPGVIAAGETRQETERLMLEAMAEHIALLRDSGQPIPQPAEAAGVTMLDPAAA